MRRLSPLSLFALLGGACIPTEAPVPDSLLPTAEELTVKTSACLGFSDPFDAPGAMLRVLWSPTAGDYRARLEAQMVCIGEATTCSAVSACIDAEVVASCEAGCEGSVAVQCRTNTVALRNDCALDPGGRTECIQGACFSPECSGEAAPTCSGNVLESCSGGRLEVVDCAQFGGTCGATSTGKAVCVMGGVACDPTAPAVCKGATLVTCEMDKGHGSLDCSQLPMTGATCSPDTARCEFGVESGPAACVSTCEGNMLNGCVGNTSYTLDCSLMPGAICSQADNGEPACVMP